MSEIIKTVILNSRTFLQTQEIAFDCAMEIACGGSWMVNGSLIKNGKFDEIEKLVREASEIVREIRG